jgi:hypothetical protein
MAAVFQVEGSVATQQEEGERDGDLRVHRTPEPEPERVALQIYRSACA